MLVERCEQIDRFKKTQYFVTHLLVDDRGKMIDAVSENFADKKEAEQLASACNGNTATVSSLERKAKTAAPPKLYDLTSLQRDANRLLGLTAAKTLNCAQALYENLFPNSQKGHNPYKFRPFGKSHPAYPGRKPEHQLGLSFHSV
jgi:DNA topoisomerase-3